jgi:hypothetical protein
MRCVCGAKILVVPDLVAMSRALKRYLTKHKDADEQFLIAQIFDVACKQAVHQNISAVCAVQSSSFCLG